MKKINSIGYGYKIISIGILFGFIFPILIFLIPCKSSILYILSKISLFTGITIIILFFIWLKIELNQDRRINEHYEKHKNEKLLIGKEKYECQACGNRQVKLNDERCNICGIKFADTGGIEHIMEYINETKEHAEKIADLVQNTIRTIYPKYYPKEVVEFFCKLHCKENIEEDIKKGYLRILLEGNCILGTGSYIDNHITRVYVDPGFQGKGYGSFIIKKLEKEIALTYDTICLDASLPASRLYEKLGYKTIKHEKYIVENDAVLVYEIMEKKLI